MPDGAARLRRQARLVSDDARAAQHDVEQVDAGGVAGRGAELQVEASASLARRARDAEIDPAPKLSRDDRLGDRVGGLEAVAVDVVAGAGPAGQAPEQIVEPLALVGVSGDGPQLAPDRLGQDAEVERGADHIVALGGAGLVIQRQLREAPALASCRRRDGEAGDYRLCGLRGFW